MAKKTVKKKTTYDLLNCIESIIERSRNSKMNAALLKNSKVKTLAEQMQVTPTQAVIFSLCMHYGPANTLIRELSQHLDISHIAILHYCDDIEVLVRRGLLRYRDSDQMSFDVPMCVVGELKHNKVFFPPSVSGLDVQELFSRFNKSFNELKDGTLPADALISEVNQLLDNNSELYFVRSLKELDLDVLDLMLLVMFCHYCVNDDDNNILFSDIEDLYAESCVFTHVKSSMRHGTHPLMRKQLIEFVCEDGQACTSRFKLTESTKRKLLADFQLSSVDEKIAGIITPAELTAKDMFYTSSLERKVKEMTAFVEKDEFKKICGRMKEKGLHSGLACLFYGSPGTGKTETVYQIARATGRSIFLVDVPQIRSKWVGESEKNIQAIFTQYRQMVKVMDDAPILLFNEADAIIGTRMQGVQSSVDKMENTIQNIILQEMENLEGILIATTNLEGNLDPAFERRFLYKIKFDKPDAQVRQHIWHAMLPQLHQEETAELARKFTFSGAQIENVVRKITVYEILHGKTDSYMTMLRNYCSEEFLMKNANRKCGFV